MRPNAFPRSRRLKRRRLLRPLFDRARPDVGRVRVGSVVVLFRAVERVETGEDAPLQVCFAPGRAARGAGRVRLRRLLRESFRLHQHALLDALAGRPDCLTLVVLFRGPVATADRDLPRDLPEALRRLAARPVPPPLSGARNDVPSGP
ncbi:MAG TPA: ribonuclease P [Rubricoccaceae bacterium]